MLLALVSAPRLFGGGPYSQMGQPVGARADIAIRQPTRVQWPTELVVRASCGGEHDDEHGGEHASITAPQQIPIDAAP